MKKILLPIDFSDNARSAVEYAISMFRYEDTEYILLNVFTEPMANVDTLVSINDILTITSKNGLEKEYNYFNEKAPNSLLKMEKRSVYGALSYVINNISKKENIDYVVMGTKGMSGMKRVFLGSNTADVVSMINCPLLAIPDNVKYTPPFRIGFAADYDIVNDISILNPLINLVKQYQSELSIVNVYSEDELISITETEEGIKLHHAFKEISHYFYDIESEDTVGGIEEFLEVNDINILTMIARKHHFFEHLFQTSITQKMSMLAKMPILILHEK